LTGQLTCLLTCCAQIEYGEEDGAEESDSDRSMSLSPLAKKVPKSPKKSNIVPQPIIEKRTFVPDPPMLPSDTEDAELTETETEGDDDGANSVAPSGVTASSDDEHDDDDDDDEYSEEEEEEEMWEPPSAKTPKANKQSMRNPGPSFQPKASKSAVASKDPFKSRVSKLAEDLDELDITGQDPDDSVAIIPKEKGKSRTSADSNAVREEDDDEGFDLPVVKKKKRYICLFDI
jgi:kinesin family protein 20